MVKLGGILKCKKTFRFKSNVFIKKSDKWCVGNIKMYKSGHIISLYHINNINIRLRLWNEKDNWKDSVRQLGHNSIPYLWDYFESKTERAKRIIKQYDGR